MTDWIMSLTDDQFFLLIAAINTFSALIIVGIIVTYNIVNRRRII